MSCKQTHTRAQKEHMEHTQNTSHGIQTSTYVRAHYSACDMLVRAHLHLSMSLDNITTYTWVWAPLPSGRDKAT